MDDLARWNIALNLVQKANEFLVAMALHVLSGHGAVENVQRCEQGGRTVALVIMGHGRTAPLFHRQAGLGAVEGLYPGLFVDRKHHGMGQW